MGQRHRDIGTERSSIKAVKLDVVSGLVAIRKVKGIPSARVKELWGVVKGVENGRITKRV